jgi:hypothetical protein
MAGQSISTTIHTTKLKNIYMVWEIEKSRSIASIQRNSWPIAQATAKKSLILLKSNRKNTFIHSLYKWYIDAQDPPLIISSSELRHCHSYNGGGT